MFPIPFNTMQVSFESRLNAVQFSSTAYVLILGQSGYACDLRIIHIGLSPNTTAGLAITTATYFEGSGVGLLNMSYYLVWEQ